MGIPKRISRIGMANPLFDANGFSQRPGIDRFRFDRFKRYPVAIHLKVREIAQQEPERVANLAIALSGDLEEVEIDLDIVLEGE